MIALRKMVVVWLLVLTLGLQWTLLQSVAWVSMLVRYSQETPFRTAVIRTFDGQHPCSLCKAIAHGKDSERKQDNERSNPKNPKYELSLPASEHFLFDPPLRLTPPPFVNHGEVRFFSPPKPPPRVA